MIKRADQKKIIKRTNSIRNISNKCTKFSHGFKIKVWHKFRNLLNSWSLYLLKSSYFSPPPPYFTKSEEISNECYSCSMFVQRSFIVRFFWLIDSVIDWWLYPVKKVEGNNFRAFVILDAQVRGLFCAKKYAQ